MSMILEAMKRSKEGEAHSSEVPTVDTVHYVPEPDPRFAQWQIAAFVGVVLIAVGVLLYVFWSPDPTSPLLAQNSQTSGTTASDIREDSRGTREPSATPTVASSGTSSSRSSVAAPPPVTEISVPRTNVKPMLEKQSYSGSEGSASSNFARRMAPPKAPASADELKAIYQALNAEASQMVGQEAGSPASRNREGSLSVQNGAAGVDDRAPNPLSGAGAPSVRDNTPTRPTAQQNEAPPVDFADILAAARNELGVKALVESSEPLLETLSQQIKDEIPSLIYSEHRYDPVGTSWVTLNGKVLKERQRVGAFTVIEILPDSAVLRWRETQFRVRARNSWINM